MAKWELKWRGESPYVRPNAKCAIVHSLGNDLWWYQDDTDLYVAVITSDMVEQAWAKLETQCRVEHRVNERRLPDDWRFRFAIGYKGFRVVEAKAAK